MRTSFREALIAHMDAGNVGATVLAKVTGVPKTLIDKLYQRRIDATNVHDAMRLAAFFGKTVNDMAGGDQDNQESKINALLSQLTPDEKQLVEAQLEGLLSRRRPR